MKLHKIVLGFGLALTVTCGGLGFVSSTPANAQKLVNPGARDDSWRPIKTMVFNHLLKDFKKNIPLGRSAKVEVAPLVIAELQCLSK
ncbi:MAG: hypothetical protein KME29_16145 [Calothrix sp. FI2-JRJ7]|jgi:hypothetical protein|nr:hypothetical protein [Calothrix sp. FI2-JRJ7]